MNKFRLSILVDLSGCSILVAGYCISVISIHLAWGNEFRAA